MPPIINEALCNVCGNCYEGCPQDVFAWRDIHPPVVAYPYECWYCGACVIDCPTVAIHLALPLRMHIVPSPALYGPPAPEEQEMVRKAADFSRSVIGEQGRKP